MRYSTCFHLFLSVSTAATDGPTLLPSHGRVMTCKIYIELPTLDRQLDLNMNDFGLILPGSFFVLQLTLQ